MADIDQTQQDDQDEEEQIKTDSSKPQISGVEFALIGLVAIIKDLADIIGTATVFGIIIGFLINFPATLILWFWCLIKFHKFPLKRFISTTIFEFIPLIGALPLWTAFVASLWIEQQGYMPNFLKNK